MKKKGWFLIQPLYSLGEFYDHMPSFEFVNPF